MNRRLPSICFVAPNAFPVLAQDDSSSIVGGAELQQVIVAKGLAERGYEVSMICLDFGQPDEVEVNGVKVFRAFRPDEGVPVLRFFWPRLTKLWNCLKRVDADIYYQRTAGMLTGVVAEFARRSSKKSIFAAAGNPDFEPKTSRIRYARDRWLYEYGLRNVDLILAQNRDQQRLCRHHFGRDAIIVQNCFPPASKPPQILKPIVLWVSTVRALKRPEQFLDLAEALPNYCFRMIGGPDSGNEKLFEAIQKRADKIENVEFLGFVPPSKIDSYFDQASILVNTSESEGFPNTFLQAWSRGVPTVSFVDCGARAAGQPVGHQVESFEQMKIIVGEWLSDLTEQIREGQRCRRYFERNHTPSKVLCIYEEIFNELYRENS